MLTNYSQSQMMMKVYIVFPLALQIIDWSSWLLIKTMKKKQKTEKRVFQFKRRNLIYSVDALLFSLGNQHGIADSDFQSFVGQLQRASIIIMMMRTIVTNLHCMPTKCF